MLKLGVNIDHVATLRQARYRDAIGDRRVEPDPVVAALACERAGCHGITAHLREDRRHIIDRDIWRLREAIRTRLNFEMANAPEIVDLALKVKPEVVCLVPERREELTTEGGLDVAGQLDAITTTRQRMNDAGIEVSLFIAPEPAQVTAAAQSGAQFIELHTGRFADHYHQKRERNEELQRLISAAQQARNLGLQVNAGHGFTTENVQLIHLVPHLVELNIGHSIVSRAIFIGLEAAVKEMLKAMGGYPG
ncbi:MAG TPA: pyridoxine 5'-phosphate synthase [Candidatus Limnocylindria bacterium]|jgi:pyridoxine 5-phosphate synthase|nr:pyridoxine 5'-phosphate synthase [Candidatus Limnocylindria bacterium]